MIMITLGIQHFFDMIIYIYTYIYIYISWFPSNVISGIFKACFLQEFQVSKSILEVQNHPIYEVILKS